MESQPNEYRISRMQALIRGFITRRAGLRMREQTLNLDKNDSLYDSEGLIENYWEEPLKRQEHLNRRSSELTPLKNQKLKKRSANQISSSSMNLASKFRNLKLDVLKPIKPLTSKRKTRRNKPKHHNLDLQLGYVPFQFKDSSTANTKLITQKNKFTAYRVGSNIKLLKKYYGMSNAEAILKKKMIF